MKNGGYRSIFCLLFSLCMAFVSTFAFAATVEWTPMPDRERLTITLEKSEGALGDASRSAKDAVRIGLPPTAGEMAFGAPALSRLVKSALSTPGELTIRTTTPAFGYMFQKVSPQVANMDIFFDPLGERWKDPNATEAPAGQTQRTQPQTPAVSTEQVEPAQAAQPASAQAVTEPAAALASAAPQGSTAPQTTAQVTQPQAAQQAPASSPVSTIPMERPSPPAPSVATAVLPASALGGEGNAAPPSTAAPATTPATSQNITPERIPQIQLPTMPEPSAQTAAQTAGQAGPVNAINPAAQIPAQAAPAAQIQQQTPAQAQTQPQEQASPGKTSAPQQPVRYKVNLSSDSSAGTAQAPAQTAQGNSSGRIAISDSEKNALNPTDQKDQKTAEQNSAPAASGRISAVKTEQPSQTNQSGTPAKNAHAPAEEAANGSHKTENAAAKTEGKEAPKNAKEGAAKESAAKEAPPKEVLKDEKGNPIPPPPDPVEVLKNIEQNIAEGKFDDARKAAEELLLYPGLTKDQREQLLHRKADMIYAINSADPIGHYSEIINSTQDAVNFNLQSPRNAAAYLRLGYVNLKAENKYEASSYFNILRKQFPKDEGVPLSYFYWGDYHYGHGNFQEAVDQYDYVIQNYPTNRYARDAAIGLAKSYYALNYNDQAYKVMEFIERNNPEYYKEAPGILTMMGDIAMRVNQFDKARLAYWTYYNLLPNASDIDVVLTRLGDIYTLQKQKSAAKEVYSEAVRRFPKTDAGLVAMMRIAEEGVYDAPRLDEMTSIFDKHLELRPVDVYTKIINEFPDSPLVSIARLKLAMWDLWADQYKDALDQASQLLANNPDPVLAARAKEVAMKAFVLMTARNVQEQRYGQVRDLWQQYPILRSQEESLDPESRMALAASFMKQNNSEAALMIAEPFFLDTKIPKYSEMALSLALSIYLENFQWKKVEELASRVELWELTPEMQTQLDYALALAYENQDKGDQAKALWEKLYGIQNLPPEKLAYVEYFLSKSAIADNDLAKAYQLGQDALRLFAQMAEKDPQKADAEKIKSQLSSLMDISESVGRMPEALNFAAQYQKYLDPKSLEYLSVEYSKARIYKKQGDLESWQRIITDLAQNSPDTLYGRMASSELRSLKLRENAASFSPTGNL